MEKKPCRKIYKAKKNLLVHIIILFIVDYYLKKRKNYHNFTEFFLKN